MIYKGYFSNLDCKQYEVRISTSGGSEVQEILLADDQPFVVQYNVSQTPFDPVRTSVATINIVHNDYLQDALSHCAQGTVVELLDVTNSGSPSTVWIGYMTPKVYDAGYENCYESFSLEAADCISSLQYKDYAPLSGGGITNLRDIIGSLCDAAGELDGFYWTRSKEVGTNTILIPENMSISEHNFQTNDTDEYWKMSEVLEEVCRYLGFTCLQYGTSMYFVDYQYLETHNDIYASWYPKANNYNKSSSDTHLDGAYTVTSGSYLSNGATISFEPVYNKVVVNANMYAVEDYIPNPFDDAFVINRINSADTYANIEIFPISPDKATYPHGSTWYSLGFEQKDVEEESGDTSYRYFHRIYDNKYWESVYTNETGGSATPSEGTLASSDITRDYRGGTIIDMGVVRKEHKSATQQWIVPSKLDYTRYICICEKHTNDHNRGTSLDKGSNQVVFRLKSGYTPNVKLDDKCFLVLNCKAVWERYEDRNYINPDWCNTECKVRGTAAGSWWNSVARPKFRIKIGNKSWNSNSNSWVPASNSVYCEPEMKWDEKKTSFWNKEIEILNNVSWEDKVNCEGVKIPLSGIDTSQPIEFEIINPDPAFYGNTGNPDFDHRFYDYNAYCWIKDLSLTCVREGQSDLGNDNDVIYENEIDECSVNDMQEIKVKITTQTDMVKPSYSHMLYTSGFITTVKERSIPREQTDALLPEQNIIAKYVHQYSTPTRRITLTLGDDIKPFQKLFGVDVENENTGYVQLGGEIDYRMGRQTITTIQKNK